MIGRLIERAARRSARRLRLAGRSGLLRLAHHGSRASPPPPGEVRNIVALRLDRLGDLVLTLPALDDLAAAYPGAGLTVLVRPGLACLLRNRPAVTRVVAVPLADDLAALSARVAALQADLGVDFSAQDELLAARALARAGVPVRVGLAGGGREVFFSRTAALRGEPLSLPEINGRIVEAAGGVASGSSPGYSVPPDEDRQAEESLRSLGAPAQRPRIAVHPGGTYPTQRWPLERFAAAAECLAERYHAKIVLLGGPGDTDQVAALSKMLAAGSVVVAPGDLRRLVAVMARCDLLLCNNSGPLHLAGAVGLPTVSTLGPTHPARFRPQGRRQEVLRLEGLRCSPCTRGRCTPHDCLLGIASGDVVRAAERLFDEVRAERSRATVEVGP